jgi:predicted ATP-dependent serine protease
MNKSKLTYSQQYYIKIKAQRLGMSVEDYMNSDHYNNPKIARSSKQMVTGKSNISFERVKKLSDLLVDENMLKTNKTDLPVDSMFSHEGGLPVGTNIMCTGDPGVGKTTLLLHTLSNVQSRNENLKCLFISAEMSKLQIFKYMKRFPMFSNIETLFTSDYLDCNMKDVIEQLLESGYDYILMDSIVEVLDSVKEDNGWSQSSAEKWLIELCVRHNEANNRDNRYTTFLLIQQVT